MVAAVLALGMASVCGVALAEPKPKPVKAAAAEKPAPPISNLPKIPKPGKPSAEETAFRERLDQILAPVANASVSAEDAAKIKEAIQAVAAKDQAAADAIIPTISDAAGQKLVLWYRLKTGFGTPKEYVAFLEANPTWPERQTLMQRAEEVLFSRGGSVSEITAFFGNREPETGPGKAALASAHLAAGRESEAKTLAAKAWREEMFPAYLEPAFLARFSSLLSVADHKWRLDRLLIDTVRWQADKAQRAEVANRTIALLPADEQKIARARLAIFQGGKSAKTLQGLPNGKDPDWGLVFHQVQSLRRAGKIEEAAKLLLGAPTTEALTVVPDSWWEERQAVAYEALKIRKPKLAYEIVREAGPLSVNPAKEQTFMAGWIALRFLKDTEKAEAHFLAMRKAADGPLSRAKASYWLGRTAEAKSKREDAQEFYRAALRDPDTFHAMLSREKLEPGARLAYPVTPPQEPSAAEIQNLRSLDSVRALVIARRAGLDASIMRAFFVSLRTALKGEGETALLAHLADMLGDTQSSLRIGKMAIARGLNLTIYAYPTAPFPAYTPLRSPPEAAFMLGIARQETEFNTLIVSGAGAKGLLQVMTITAKHVCQDYKIKCEIGRLLTDPSYNATISSAYIGDRMEEFRGSYVLAIAGYNAGPGRARQWIREFGDPRDPAVDVIDWIERIPIQETREYVGKVLANIQVYRARIGEERTAVRIAEDLARARGTASRAAADEPSDG